MASWSRTSGADVRGVTALWLGLVLMLPTSAGAVELDVGGFFRSVAVVAPIRTVGSDEVQRGLDVFARHRLMANIDADTWAIEAHGVVGGSLVALDSTPRLALTGPNSSADYLRWPGLSWSKAYGDKRQALAAEIDRLVLKWHPGPVDVAVGRQPINLATTMIFTPHDVFAPFSPLDFFRAYKPGVDAVQLHKEVLLEGRVRSIRASVIGAMGYQPSELPDFSADPQLDRAALLARLAVSTELSDVVLMGGRGPRRWLVGLAVQSDVGGWLLRAEHVSQVPLEDHAGFDGHMLVAGVMKQVTPELSVVAEGLVKHGTYQPGGGLFGLLALPTADVWGANGVDKWLKDRTETIVNAAASASWQVHPLVAAQGLLWFSDKDNVVLGNYTTWNFSSEGVAAGGFGINLADTKTWFINAEVRWSW